MTIALSWLLLLFLLTALGAWLYSLVDGEAPGAEAAGLESTGHQAAVYTS